MMKRIALITLILTTLFFSCRRDNLSTGNYCERLKEGMAANDIDKVKSEITNFIAALPSSDYNAANINQLCQRISSGCGASAEVLCIDCIKTLPSQSEIKINFDTSISAQTKIIDLSYTTANPIAFRDMHD